MFNILQSPILNFNLDPIPKYLMMRDVFNLNKNSKRVIDTKSKVLETDWVKNIIKLQYEDGSWGQFHSMSQSNMTTEQALRRLLILGLDIDDEPIKKALDYMDRYLNRTIDLRDRKEKKHDWDLLTRLFVATWVRIIDPQHPIALEIAKDWAKVVTYAFKDGAYNLKDYKEAYDEVHRPQKQKQMWGIENYYVVSIITGLLLPTIESNFLDHIIQADNGIYYIYDKPISVLPDSFCTKSFSKYLNACELISRYSSASEKLKHVEQFLISNVSDDGLFDMGQNIKDQIHFPLSNSWRIPINRKIDCTVRILKILSNLSK